MQAQVNLMDSNVEYRKILNSNVCFTNNDDHHHERCVAMILVSYSTLTID